MRGRAKGSGDAPAALLHERVVQEMTTRIVSGEWPPGFLVPTEAELTELTRVSRTVVREAMRLMVDRGLVNVRQGKGTVVAPRAEWDLLDPLILAEGLRHRVVGVADHVVETRRQLEPALAGIAAERITPAQLEAIEGIQRSIEEHPDDADLANEAGVRFHEAIAEAANNPLLTRMVMPIYEAMRVWGETRRLSREERRASQREHAGILQALQAGDRKGAAAAAARHVLETFDQRLRGGVSAGAGAGTGGSGERG